MSLNIPQCLGRHPEHGKHHPGRYVRDAEAEQACSAAVGRWNFHHRAVWGDSHYLLASEKWKVQMQMHFLSEKYAPCSEQLVQKEECRLSCYSYNDQISK